MGNATTKHSQKIQDPNARKLLGKKVYYIGNMVCSACGRVQKRGMVSEYQGQYYCSESCVQNKRIEGENK